MADNDTTIPEKPTATVEEYYNNAYFDLKRFVINNFALKETELTENLNKMIGALAASITLVVKKT